MAHSSKESMLVIVVQPDSVVKRPLDDLRNHLEALKIDNAIFFDGSDSAMMMVNGLFEVRAGSNKNETNITGIGFKY